MKRCSLHTAPSMHYNSKIVEDAIATGLVPSTYEDCAEVCRRLMRQKGIVVVRVGPIGRRPGYFVYRVVEDAGKLWTYQSLFNSPSSVGHKRFSRKDDAIRA